MNISEIFCKCGGYKQLGLADSNEYPDFYSIYDVLMDFYQPKLNLEAASFVSFAFHQIKKWEETKNRSHIDMLVYGHKQRKLDFHQIVINLIVESSSLGLNDEKLCAPKKVKKEYFLEQAILIMMNLTFDNRTSIDNAALKASYQILLIYGNTEYMASTLSKKYAELVRSGKVEEFHAKWREDTSSIEDRHKRIDSFPMPPEEIKSFLEGTRR